MLVDYIASVVKYALVARISDPQVSIQPRPGKRHHRQHLTIRIAITVPDLHRPLELVTPLPAPSLLPPKPWPPPTASPTSGSPPTRG